MSAGKRGFSAGSWSGYPDQDPALKPRLPADIVLHTDGYQELDQNKLADYDATMRDYYDVRTGGKLEQSWSDQISNILSKEARPFMLSSLNKQGFAKKWVFRANRKPDTARCRVFLCLPVVVL